MLFWWAVAVLQGFCSLACQIAAITYTHTRTHTRAWLGADGSMCAPPVHSLYAWAWEWPGGLPPLAKAGGPGCLMAQPRHRVESQLPKDCLVLCPHFYLPASVHSQLPSPASGVSFPPFSSRWNWWNCIHLLRPSVDITSSKMPSLIPA